MLPFKNIVLFLGLLLYSANYSKAATLEPLEKANYNLFAKDLFSSIIDGKSSENIIYSPAAIQTGMTLAFIGAEGETAEKLRKDLRLGHGDKTYVARNFADFLRTSFKANHREYAPQLKMANRLYVSEDLHVCPEFKRLAKEYFETETETIQFEENDLAAQKINKWLNQATENKIKDLLHPSDINADTTTVLVNGIYFQGTWQKPFNALSTQKAAFYVKEQQQQDVEFMYNKNKYRFVELPELDACALELPYNNTDISMLIVLPHDKDGLERLESKLKEGDLQEISSKMSENILEVYLPKFRLEYDLNVRDTLDKMGLSYVFSPFSNFEGFFAEPLKRPRSEKLKHKAYLDVNEYGSESAAATVFDAFVLSTALDAKIFRADHPFYFAIRCNSAVYFAGHLAQI